MTYGQRYRIRKISGEVVEGEHIESKGNDGDYPTFRLDDGGLLGVHISNVLGVYDEAGPVGAPETPGGVGNGQKSIISYIHCACGAEASSNTAGVVESWYERHVASQPDVKHAMAVIRNDSVTPEPEDDGIDCPNCSIYDRNDCEHPEGHY